MQDFTDQISAIAARLDEASGYLRIDELKMRQPQLEAEASRPDLWDDQEKARKVTSELSAVNEDLELYDRLQSIAMGDEMGIAPMDITRERRVIVDVIENVARHVAEHEKLHHLARMEEEGLEDQTHTLEEIKESYKNNPITKEAFKLDGDGDGDEIKAREDREAAVRDKQRAIKQARAAIVRDGQVHFQAGAGIVADSNPEMEYEETLAKARGFEKALSSNAEIAKAHRAAEVY